MRYLKNTTEFEIKKPKKEKIKMKKTLLIFLMLAFVSSASALSYLTMDRGLLDGHAEAAFSGGGGQANLLDGEHFIFRGYGDHILFESDLGQNWSYSDHDVYSSELTLVDPFNFNEDDIMTITGTALHNSNTSYSIGFIKILSGNAEMLRIVRVNSVVLPELDTFSLWCGFAGLGYVMVRRRRG
jgi:hypothetical protein